MDDENKDKVKPTDKIEGHTVCQTRDARWLCLNNIYNHFQRPNFYDVGGTYIEESASFWFMYKTEQVSNLYLLHLFVSNRQAGSFSLTLCNSNEMTLDDHTMTIYLKSLFKVCNFNSVPDSHYNYLMTYSFDELDVEVMKGKKLLIAVVFNNTPMKELQIPVDYIKGLHDFGQLLSDPVCSDFTMISGDGEKFSVHKFLLAGKSEVFKAMLKDDTAESINNIVTISDVNKEDLSCIIEFIYTGTVKDIENKNCISLLMLGDRYDLKGLKELAQHTLAQLLNNDNALETLMAADLYNSATLKVSTFKYIKMNIASLDSFIFKEITNIQLVQELCKYLAMKC